MEKKNNSSQSSSVLIILAYKDGPQFINEQLESIATQDHKNFTVKIFDDASDTPLTIDEKKLRNFSRGQLSVYSNKTNLGYCANFLRGLSVSKNNFDYYSFCDQDDIWHQDKLSKAVNALSKYDDTEPVLYCSRTEIYSSNEQKTTGISSNFKREPCFANAIIQNIAGGNTMVMNKSARELIVKASKGIKAISHDWWSYMIITGAGGKVIFDTQPSLKYRQHEENKIGFNGDIKGKLRRIKMLLFSEFKMWNDINIQALEKNRSILLPENQKTLELFKNAKNGNIFARIYSMFKSGIHRQTISGNIALWVAVVIRKL